MSTEGKVFVGRMTSKGQTTVPRRVREMLALGEGVQMEWIVEDGKATVRPRTQRAVDLAGFLGPSPVGPVAVEDMNEAGAQAAIDRFERSQR